MPNETEAKKGQGRVPGDMSEKPVSAIVANSYSVDEILTGIYFRISVPQPVLPEPESPMQIS